MATARKRILRSPIEPGSISVKTLLSVIPLVVMAFALVGSWYIQKDHLSQLEKRVESINADLNVIKLQNAAEGDDHLILLKIRDDIDKLKRRAGID